MSSTATRIEVVDLTKAKLQALKAQARAAGLSAETYARQLIEEAVAIEEEARRRPFDDLYAIAQERFHKSGMKEEDLDRLVDAARTRHHRRTARKKD